MKHLLALMLALIPLIAAAPIASAALQGMPFLPEIDMRFNCLETGYCPTGGPYSPPGIQNGTGVFGNLNSTYWKADIVLGTTAGTANTSIVLPAKTIIKQAWFITKTVTTPAGTTQAFNCDGAVNATSDILAATDETGLSINTITAGTETGTAANMHYSSAGCTVTVLTSIHNPTAGEVTLFLETVPAY